jgi:hypothetical protein
MTHSKRAKSSFPEDAPRQKRSVVVTASGIAEIRAHHGVLTLFIANHPVLPVVIDLLPTTTAREIAACAQEGCHLYRFREVGPGWQGVGSFDFSPLEARLKMLLSADPKAVYWLEVRVDAPDWWLRTHPEECVFYGLPLPSGSEEKETRSASWASRRWRNEAGAALDRLVRFVQQGEWGGRCIGYQIAAGEAGEWRNPDPGRFPDIGPRMTEQFRAFALEKYRRNTGLLRKAWFDTRAEFNAVTCPDVGERRRANIGIFRNPHLSRRILDYLECLCQSQNQAALHFSSVVKRATGGQSLVGLSYAHAYGNESVAEAGHGFAESVLEAEDVDFFTNAGTADALRGLPESLKLRNKLYFHVAPAESSLRGVAIATTHQAGIVLPASSGLEAFRSTLDIYERCSQAPAKLQQRVSQVAVVMDLAAAHYVSEDEAGRQILETLLNDQMRELNRLGAPFDTYLISDLFHPGFPDYKVTLFLNCFYLSEAERRRIDARIKRSGQTAVWLWAPGVIGEESIEDSLGQRCCGQKVRLERGAANLRVRIVEANDPLTWGHHIGATFGIDRPIAPTITIADKAATRLGANSANKTVFSVRRSENWTSVVFGALSVPSSLLRNVLRSAGCHLYTEKEGASVLANAGLLAVTSENAGTLNISLPGIYDVIDAATGEAVAQVAANFTVNVSPGETIFYQLLPRRAF